MKNAKMTIVAVLVALVAVTTYSVGGTYAKYTDTFTGTSDSARVALWDIDLKDEEGNSVKQADKSFTFKLFDTILDNNLGAEETDVAEGLIAPGTSGKVNVKLVNNSEVNAEYTVTFNANIPANLPIEFSTNGTDWAAAPTNTTTPVRVDSAKVLNTNAGEDDIQLFWRWAFNGDDDLDTSFGVKGTDTVTVTATIVVNQVD